jgi:hypothetical protein
MYRTFSVCSDLQTKQLAWASYKNGELKCHNGQPIILQSYEIAAVFRDHYAGDVKKVTV